MLKKIIKMFPNTEKVVGSDGRYHTVYYIEFDTGHYYVGKHTSDNLDSDTYFASGRLPIQLKSNGVKFKRQITHFLTSSDAALALETSILSCKSIYENELCLNCYPGSPPDGTGSIVMSKGRRIKMANPKLVVAYQREGWVIGKRKALYMSKGGTVVRVDYDDIDSFLERGYLPGSVKSRGRVFIEKAGVFKYITQEFLSEYLSTGWVKKHNVAGRKVIRTADGKILKVQPENLNKFLSNGAVQTSTVDGLIYIKKNTQYKRVRGDELSDFLADGWMQGNNASGMVYVSNGIVEKRVARAQLDEYLQNGYTGVRLKKLYMNNGSTERRVTENDINTIHSLLTSGFVHGKLYRAKKTMVYKNKDRRVVHASQLDEFLSDGWTDKFDATIHYHPRLGTGNRHNKHSSRSIQQ